MRNSRADVVAAALRVLDEHGLEFCSMRRVAAALDVQPSALYHHVPDKQTLLALMADQIVRDVWEAHRVDQSRSAATAAAHGAKRGVRDVRGSDAAQLSRALRRALLAVRDGAEVVATASAYRLGGSAVEARLAELIGADGARTLVLFVFGHAQATQTQLQAFDFGVLPIAADGPGDPPSRADMEAELEASFARGVEIVLAGLR